MSRPPKITSENRTKIARLYSDRAVQEFISIQNAKLQKNSGESKKSQKSKSATKKKHKSKIFKYIGGVFVFILVVTLLIIMFKPDFFTSFISSSDNTSQSTNNKTDNSSSGNSGNSGTSNTPNNGDSGTSPNSGGGDSNNNSKNNSNNNSNNNSSTDTNTPQGDLASLVKQALLKKYDISDFTELTSKDPSNIAGKIKTISNSNGNIVTIRLNVPYTETSRNELKEAAKTFYTDVSGSVSGLKSIMVVSSDNYYIERYPN